MRKKSSVLEKMHKYRLYLSIASFASNYYVISQ